MPHFVVDCSADVLALQSMDQIIRTVHHAARASTLFNPRDIKVRVNPYTTYSVGDHDDSFIHVFAHIMQGRTVAQRADLSRAVVESLTALLPGVPNIAMNVAEFEQATYCNRRMV